MEPSQATKDLLQTEFLAMVNRMRKARVPFPSTWKPYHLVEVTREENQTLMKVHGPFHTAPDALDSVEWSVSDSSEPYTHHKLTYQTEYYPAKTQQTIVRRDHH